MRRATRVLLGLTCVVPLIPPALGLLSAAVDYRGVCFGFTDGEAPCTFLDYALTEATFALLFLPVVVLVLAVSWLVLWLRK